MIPKSRNLLEEVVSFLMIFYRRLVYYCPHRIIGILVKTRMSPAKIVLQRLFSVPFEYPKGHIGTIASVP